MRRAAGRNRKGIEHREQWAVMRRGVRSAECGVQSVECGVFSPLKGGPFSPLKGAPFSPLTAGPFSPLKERLSAP